MSNPNRTAALHHYGDAASDDLDDARIQPFNDANFHKLHIQFLLTFASSTIKATGSADYDHGPHHFAYQTTLTVKTDHDAERPIIKALSVSPFIKPRRRSSTVVHWA